MARSVALSPCSSDGCAMSVMMTAVLHRSRLPCPPDPTTRNAAPTRARCGAGWATSDRRSPSRPGPGQQSVWDFPRPPQRRRRRARGRGAARRGRDRPHPPRAARDGNRKPADLVPAAGRRADGPAAAGRRRIVLRMERRRPLSVGRDAGRAPAGRGVVVPRRHCPASRRCKAMSRSIRKRSTAVSTACACCRSLAASTPDGSRRNWSGRSRATPGRRAGERAAGALRTPTARSSPRTAPAPSCRAASCRWRRAPATRRTASAGRAPRRRCRRPRRSCRAGRCEKANSPAAS